MLIGQDFSHYNDFTQLLDNATFVWLKATEGKTWTDPQMTAWIEHISLERKDNLPVMGFYHYARPENRNSAENEAEHFLNTIKPHIGQCLMALDVEGEALSIGYKQLGTWCQKWCSYVFEHTGVTPFIYCGEDVAKQLGNYVISTIPFWIARWGVKDRPAMADMWQFTSTPFDISIYYGSLESLVARALPAD